MEITKLRAEIEVKTSISKTSRIIAKQKYFNFFKFLIVIFECFQKFLEFFEKGNIISIEEAIRKITYLPAQF